MTKYTIIILFLIALFGCKKNKVNEVLFEGSITEIHTGNPISGCNVIMSERKIINNSVSIHFTYTNETITNTSGRFNINIPKEKTIEYKLSIEKEGFYSDEVIFNIDDVSLTEVNSIDFLMNQETWLKFRIFNDGAANDKLSLYRKNSKPDCEFCCDNNLEEFQGIMDSVFYCRTVANRYFNFEYFKSNSFGNQFFKDSIYCQPQDTLEIFISF